MFFFFKPSYLNTLGNFDNFVYFLGIFRVIEVRGVRNMLIRLTRRFFCSSSVFSRRKFSMTKQTDREAGVEPAKNCLDMLVKLWCFSNSCTPSTDLN